MTDRKDENKLALEYAVALRKYCSEHVCMAGCVFAEYNSEADILCGISFLDDDTRDAASPEDWMV